MQIMKVTVSESNAKLLALGRVCIIRDMALCEIDSHQPPRVETRLGEDEVQKDSPEAYVLNSW